MSLQVVHAEFGSQGMRPRERRESSGTYSWRFLEAKFGRVYTDKAASRHPKTEPTNGILGLSSSLRSPPWCVGSKRVIRIAGIHKIGTGGTQ